MAKETTVILKCTCSHEFQDQQYGEGMRVHNVDKNGRAFCTVCAPSYRRNKNGTDLNPSPILGHGLIKGRAIRKHKQVA